MDSGNYDLWDSRNGKGAGVVVKKDYKLKKDITGWIQAMKFADQDFYITLPSGTVVDVVLLHDDDSYSVVKTASMKEFGFGIFQEKEARFESDSYELKK